MQVLLSILLCFRPLAGNILAESRDCAFRNHIRHEISIPLRGIYKRKAQQLERKQQILDRFPSPCGEYFSGNTANRNSRNAITIELSRFWRFGEPPRVFDLTIGLPKIKLIKIINRLFELVQYLIKHHSPDISIQLGG